MVLCARMMRLSSASLCVDDSSHAFLLVCTCILSSLVGQDSSRTCTQGLSHTHTNARTHESALAHVQMLVCLILCIFVHHQSEQDSSQTVSWKEPLSVDGDVCV